MSNKPTLEERIEMNTSLISSLESQLHEAKLERLQLESEKIYNKLNHRVDERLALELINSCDRYMKGR
jgi:hypothetical protein